MFGNLLCALFGHDFIRDRGGRLFCHLCGKVLDA